MIRDLLNKGRELADKVTNMVMNFSEVELKVREATSDEPWGPHGQLMMQIADYTFTHNTYLEVMCTLWRRLYPENFRSWRRVYKSLVLLDFLLKNGSENVASGAREHIYDIRTLESFQFVDDNGKDQGINVRIKVQEVINLIQDPDKLKAERAKAKGNKNLYIGYGGSGGFGWSSPHYPNSYDRRYAENDFDDYENPQPKFSDRVAELPHPTQPSRLGKFEDWQVGRERGVVDDVVEQMKEVWDTAKMVTKDIFIRKESETHVYEDNPRMVSEELYEFPSAAVDPHGTIEGDFVDGQSEWPSRRNSDHTQQITTTSAKDFSDHNKPRDICRTQTTKKEKPRPPSVDLVESWEDGQTSKAPSASDPVDLLGLGTSPPDHPAWPTNKTANVSDTLWPSGSSVPVGGALVSRATELTNNSLLDADFGEFVAAGTLKPNAQPEPSFLGLDDFQPFSSSLTSPRSATHSDPSDWPEAKVDASCFSLSSQPVSYLFQSTGHPARTTITADTVMKATSKSELNGLPKSTTNVGSTWKELNELRIDLDSLGRPNKHDQRASTGPSLRQLQQQKSPPLYPPPHDHFPSGSQAARAVPVPNAFMKPVSSNLVSPSRSNLPQQATGAAAAQDFGLI